MSKGQIESANKKSVQSKAHQNLDFIHSDMRDFSLDKQFDAAISLFGSFCYLLEDDDIQRTLENIYRHLKESGILIFEFWHSGGILPSASTGGHYSWIKYEGEDHKIIRLGKSIFNHETCTLDLEFEFYVIANKNMIDEFSETHKLRTFSLGEIRTWLKKTGFDVIGLFETNTFDPPKINSFRPTAIAQKAD
jgi:SAM-dependent methyltransferase